MNVKTTDSKTYSLLVKGQTSQLADIRAFIQTHASENGVPAEIVESLILAADEAATNIVKHAYHLMAAKEIQIVFTIQDDECVIELTDCGDSFDPSLVPEPNMREYLQQRKVGGLGLFLIRTLMDSLEYQTLPDGCNVLTMKKKYHGAK